MAKVSYLGTVNSILGSTMSLGVALGAGSPILEESVTSNLSLVSTAHGIIEEWAAVDTLNISDEAVAALFSSEQIVSQPMGLSDAAVSARDRYFAVSDTMALFSLGGRTREGTSTSVLNLSQVAADFNVVGDRTPAGNTLNLTQTVETLSGIAVGQSLNLTQTVVVNGPIKVSINQWMAISQHTSTPHRAFITDTLEISDFASVPMNIFETINDVLSIVDVVQPFGVIDTLGLTQSVTVGKGHVVESTLNVTDAMLMTGLWIRNVTQNLGIGHALTWYEDTPCGKKQYTPFQGENTITTDVVAPSDTLQDPQGSTTDRLALYQPVLGIRLDEVLLRAPELDNRDRNNYNRVSRETRGGTLVVYADPDWPKIRTLAITITGITETMVDELQVFLQDTVGELIGLTDWEGRLWSGFITNPNEVATQDGKGRWTVTLEMEGEMLDVEQPGNEDGNGMAMNLTDAVGVDSTSTKWFVDDVNLSDAATGVIV